MSLQPEEYHKREQMTKVQRRSCRIYAGIEAYFAGFKDIRENIAVTTWSLSYMCAQLGRLERFTQLSG